MEIQTRGRFSELLNRIGVQYLIIFTPILGIPFWTRQAITDGGLYQNLYTSKRLVVEVFGFDAIYNWSRIPWIGSAAFFQIIFGSVLGYICVRIFFFFIWLYAFRLLFSQEYGVGTSNFLGALSFILPCFAIQYTNDYHYICDLVLLLLTLAYSKEIICRTERRNPPFLLGIVLGLMLYSLSPIYTSASIFLSLLLTLTIGGGLIEFLKRCPYVIFGLFISILICEVTSWLIFGRFGALKTILDAAVSFFGTGSWTYYRTSAFEWVFTQPRLLAIPMCTISGYSWFRMNSHYPKSAKHFLLLSGILNLSFYCILEFILTDGLPYLQIIEYSSWLFIPLSVIFFGFLGERLIGVSQVVEQVRFGFYSAIFVILVFNLLRFVLLVPFDLILPVSLSILALSFLVVRILNENSRKGKKLSKARRATFTYSIILCMCLYSVFMIQKPIKASVTPNIDAPKYQMLLSSPRELNHYFESWRSTHQIDMWFSKLVRLNLTADAPNNFSMILPTPNSNNIFGPWPDLNWNIAAHLHWGPGETTVNDSWQNQQLDDSTKNRLLGLVSESLQKQIGLFVISPDRTQINRANQEIHKVKLQSRIISCSQAEDGKVEVHVCYLLIHR